MNKEAFDNLLDTITKLRDPQNGCPWDIKQTVDSLSPALLEECCELLDGVSNNDNENIAEELGDIFFTTTLISYIMEQDGTTSTADIINKVNEKMVRRHPHVFDDLKGITTSVEVLKQWEEIKTNQEGRVKKGILDKIPSSLPPLEKSYEIQKKVEKVGFDWENITHIFDKIVEETNEVKEEIESNNRENLEVEIGDLLFSVVNLSRFLKIDPSSALRKTNSKFIKRFGYVEDEMNKKEIEMNSHNFQLMDKLWEESKKSTS